MLVCATRSRIDLHVSAVDPRSSSWAVGLVSLGWARDWARLVQIRGSCQFCTVFGVGTAIVGYWSRAL